MEIDICINQDRTEVRGMEPYVLWSNAISVSIDLFFNMCTVIIKLLVIVACMITKCIDIFIEILVMYVIQFSLDLLQMLVHELQDLFTLTKAILSLYNKDKAAYASTLISSAFVFHTVVQSLNGFLFISI